jgi:hypothetical protein
MHAAATVYEPFRLKCSNPLMGQMKQTLAWFLLFAIFT